MNDRPTSITAAEFVVGDYAAKIAVGECKVWDGVRDAIEVKTIIKVLRAQALGGAISDVYVVHWVDDEDTVTLGIHNWRDAIASDTFHVEWLDQGAASRKDFDEEVGSTDNHIAYLEQTNFVLATSNTDLHAEIERLRAALEAAKQQESDQFNRYVKQVNSTIIGYSDEFGYMLNNETIDYIILQTPTDGTSRWVATHPAIQEAIDGGWVEIIHKVQNVNDQGAGYSVVLTAKGLLRRKSWLMLPLIES